MLREVLVADPRVEVVGFARDGADALERIAELRPDVVTLDLLMPWSTGSTCCKPARARALRFVVVSTLDAPKRARRSRAWRGAIDFIHKPTSLATDRLYELGGELVSKVLAAARASVRSPGVGAVGRASPSTRDGTPPEIIVVGASTGGPRAVRALITALPGDLAAPVAIVLHMPSGYVETFADRLRERSTLSVGISRSGQALEPGMAVLAVAGAHLLVARRDGFAVARQATEPAGLHVPSVDQLFESAAAAFGARALGVVLTGMGDDGVLGARALRAAGGTVWTESAETAVIFGMPRAVRDAGASDAELPLGAIADALTAVTGRARREALP
ncbi:MAG: chemotaxis protein CheB [Polyangiaceae bacterium]